MRLNWNDILIIEVGSCKSFQWKNGWRFFFILPMQFSVIILRLCLIVLYNINVHQTYCKQIYLTDLIIDDNSSSNPTPPCCWIQYHCICYSQLFINICMKNIRGSRANKVIFLQDEEGGGSVCDRILYSIKVITINLLRTFGNNNMKPLFSHNNLS